MKTKKYLIVFLALLLAISQLAYPITAKANETQQDVPTNDVLDLFQVTKEIILENGMSISEGAYLYGETNNESIKIQLADSFINLSTDSISLIENNEGNPEYSEYVEEEVSLKVINNSTLGYSDELFNSVQVSFQNELEYPVVLDENGLEIILLGNVKFYLKDSNNTNPTDSLTNKEETSTEAADETTLIETEEESTSNETDEESVLSKEMIDNTQEQSEEEVNTDSPIDEKESIANNEEKKVFSLFSASTFTVKVDPWEGVSSDYFKVTEDNLIVYDNRFGPLRPIGTLESGQVYPRVSDYGNWHRIQFGDIYGYVKKSSTIPDEGLSLRNENNSYSNQTRTFVPLENVVVYDNTSGSLVPFGVINKGQEYPVASDYGNWWRIVYSDRVGYVRKSEVAVQFTKSDKYFRADQNSIVYDNRSGSLKPVGQLVENQVYPRVSDYGNWHRIDFGNFYGYVRKSETSYASGSEIKNLNKGYTKFRDFTALETVTVYDNTSGSLVPFGEIEKGTTFPMVSNYGEWWRVILADRVGYVRKNEVKVKVTSKDQYFRSFDNLPIYDNRTGSLVKVGELRADQSYPIHSDYGNWWRVDFGDIFGYVKKSDTGYATKNEIPNLNNSFKDSKDNIIADGKVTVYDNTSGSLVPFGELEPDTVYPIASNYGNWWRIVFLDRVGYVRKSEVKSGITHTNYNISLANAVEKQMTVNPQTDVYNGDLYVHWEAFKSLNGTTSGIIEGGWRIRSGPGTNYHTVYITGKDLTVNLLDYARENGNGAKWWRISRSSLPTWLNAPSEDVLYYMNPDNFVNDDRQKFQFLDLSKNSSAASSDLNKILVGKGILEGKGAAFIEAGLTHGVNDIYLVSHALLETGHGKSKLATGIKHNGVTVYNMYGIGAYDSCPLECGAKTAYDNGWTTPEKAIIGGAKFIGDGYVNAGQNTLYKMRWNPRALVGGSPTHQYATDIGWAYKQTGTMYNLYNQLGTYTLLLDIPKYK